MITCKQCRYFEMLLNADGKEAGFGICFALPPQVLVFDTQIQSVHPQVSEGRSPCVHFNQRGGKKKV